MVTPGNAPPWLSRTVPRRLPSPPWANTWLAVMTLVTTMRATIIILMVRLRCVPTSLFELRRARTTTDGCVCGFAGGVYSAAYAKFDVPKNTEADSGGGAQVGTKGGGT